MGYRQDGEASGELLRAMCDAIVHRGPDEAGYFVADGVALGMRRLSIIDLAGGSQPIANEDGTIQVVFNGEIYNFRELRERLLRAGHRFTTHTDTETLVHLYEEYGDRLVHELRGMFAFAIWDGRRGRLLLARDRLGIKPLYVCDLGGRLAFASELKSLRRMESCPTEISPRAMTAFLSLGYIPEPDCIFTGIRKLPPGHLLTWDGERTEEVRYWSPQRAEQASISEGEAVEEIRRLLSEAVRYRLIADVPLGAFLSGGIDSTAVVAEMARQMDRPVKTFSIGFDEPEFNEAPHAAAVARALGTEHTELVVKPDVDTLIDEVALAFDEPFADSSAIPTLLVSRLARTQVTVALSGDGGDELFAGYTRYADLARRNPPVPALVRHAVGALTRRMPHSMPARNRLLELSRTPRGRYAGMVAHSLRTDEGGLARPELAGAAARSMDELLAPWFDQVPDRDLVSQAALVDLLSYLPGDILTKVDRMTMAASLEARVPLLDHHLVEFAASLPSRLKMREGVGKWIFRRSLRGLVPDFIFTKPKQGFGVPLRLWFRRELRHRLDELLQPSSRIYEFVEPAAVRRVVREHQSGRRDQSALIWKLLTLKIWLDSDSSARTARPASLRAPVQTAAAAGRGR